MIGDMETLTVRRQWNNWKQAVYRFEDVSDLHWSKVSGGVNRRANRYYVHAYVMCDAMVVGRVAHSCKHGEGPHRIKVCIVKKLNVAVWPRVLELVGKPNPNKPVKRKPRRCKVTVLS
jgi:hypothetical protein